MRNKNQVVEPFIHFNLDYKNELLNYARSIKNQTQKRLDADLASAVIYASFSEYISSFLLNNLRHLAYLSTYNLTKAIAYIDQRESSLDKPLSYLIEQLKLFNFPDKNEFIKILTQVKDCRNKLFHHFAKGTKEDLKETAVIIRTIQDKVELLVDKLNVINEALKEIYFKISQPLLPRKTQDGTTE